MRPLVLHVLLLLFLTACDDPSSVGMGLVESQAGEPEVQTISATLTDAEGLADMTGGSTSSGALRALFGQVADPVAGDMEMTGYLDFVTSSQVDDAFKASAVESAELLLNMDYVYGDTTRSMTLDVYEVDQAWATDNVRSDTVVVARTLVTSVTFVPEPGFLRIPLPAQWVSNNDLVLRGDSFIDDFHGFAFSASDGNAIGGVHFSDSELRASSVPGDTVGFPLSKVLSLAAPAADNADTGFLFVRDGAQETVSFRVPVDTEDFGQSAIHRTILRFNTDDLSSYYPPGFNRPGLSSIGLRAVATDEETRLNVLTSGLAEDGSLSFDSDALTNIIQSANLGNSGLDRFELYVPNESSTVDFIALIKGSPESQGPRAIITLTPLN